MKYAEVEAGEIPIPLLLEGDPSEQSVRSYLGGSWCYAAILDGLVVGACLVEAVGESTAEVHNVSVMPEHHRKGIGTELLQFALLDLPTKHVRRVELGTGTFGYQLTYYQRLGFRVDSVVKDHFLINYPEPIYEDGIQHKDQLRLYIELQSGT